MDQEFTIHGFDFGCERGQVFLANLRDAITSQTVEPPPGLSLQIVGWSTRAIVASAPNIETGNENDLEGEIYVRTATGLTSELLTVVLRKIPQQLILTPAPLPTLIPIPIPSPDTAPPECFTIPIIANPSTSLGQTINLTVMFNDDVSVSRIVMYVNSATDGGNSGQWGKICDLTGISGDKVSRTCQWTPLLGGTYAGLGNHLVVANAVDAAGNLASQANSRGCSGRVSVVSPTPPPER